MDKLTINDFNVSLPSSQNVTNRKEILELKKEEKDKIPVQDLSSLNSDGVKVVFENKQGELIALNLSDENYSSLQKNFGSYTNYVARNDGSIRLNGEANEFIANWFENIEDNFNSLSSNLSSNTQDKNIKLNFHTNTITQSMQNLGFKTSDEKISDDANIEEKLNFFIDKDVNKDGKVDDSDVKEPSMREILSDIKEASGGGANAMKTIDPQKINKKDDKENNIKEKEDEDLLEIAKEKGLSALSADEQAKLKASNPQIFEELQNKSLGNLEQNLKKDLMVQISNNEAIFVNKRV
ncbi:hypothetical protein CNX24_04845 [Campylobacter coli]|uniref:EF-hand domain-containing protein n=1 Tax=Campylobacter coli TaxID=195 RepID=A0A3Z9FB83_CAMCO|nr:hypothetical protein [Campylobacter coli]EIA56144.1 hypothetical protein cco115_03669 [Campylobacter coli 2692]EIA58652.1 hypothetical protein cco117_00140 [Campylobacter coli 2698]APA56963.1 hypothetical protein BLD33_00380 [Campylobacter coli]APA58616.1 hypothetical protein BLD33_09270 [Campylobacter coli]EAB5223496.1 hypothetical protein [Campylobacter coli]